MITVAQLTPVLGAHRARNDTFDQNVDSWYCICNGIRRYRSESEVEQHIAKKLHERIAREEKSSGSTQTAIVLSYAEIKSVAEGLVKHPSDDTERMVGEHILTIMKRHLDEARKENPPRTSLRHPHVSLRDTIAMKLMVLRDTSDKGPTQLDQYRELVDDLAEYVREEVIG